MPNIKVELVKLLAKKNVALLLINNNYHVAKTPEQTEIIVNDNKIDYTWLNKNYFKKKACIANFDAEFKLHIYILKHLKSENVMIPQGELLSKNIFLMEFSEHMRKSSETDQSKKIENILRALRDIQLVFHLNKFQLNRKPLLKYNELLVFYKNVFKVTFHEKNFKSTFYNLFFVFKFTWLYIIAPRNKTSIFSHGDLRTDPSSDFSNIPIIRNLGFEKDSQKVFIYDFGSSQTKNKVIFKDIVKIFNFYPDIDIHCDHIEEYILRINDTLGYSKRSLNNILKISIILVFFAEFSACIDRNQFKSEEIVQLYKLLKLKKVKL